MATYKGIKGMHINTVAGDIGTVQLGDIWYNSILGKIRVGKTQAGAWASGNNLNTAREALGGTGIQTAALGIGGFVPPSTAKNIVESYDGTSWTEITDINTARRLMASAGTTTSAIVFGGGPPQVAIAESWNGSSWTEVADLNLARSHLMGAGASNTSALAYGGTDGSTYPAPDYHTGKTESWNGTAWTEVADLGTGRYGAGADGTATAAIAVGGTAAGAKTETETWNGTAWTETTDINTGRSYLEAAGTTTSAVAFGGNPATGKTESWDGSSWTELADMATARLHSGGAGASNTSALVFGGTAPPDSGLNATEEWTGETTVAATVTSS